MVVKTVYWHLFLTSVAYISQSDIDFCHLKQHAVFGRSGNGGTVT